MKIVKVTYKVKPGFSEQNKENIRAVMAKLQTMNLPGINYNTCVQADGNSFIHSAFFKTEEDQQRFSHLEEFQTFQRQLKADGLEGEIRQDVLTLVGSSQPIFPE